VLAQLHRHAPPRSAWVTSASLARLRESSPIALAGDWLAAPHVEGELASGLRAAAEVSRRASRP
jgi:predicted NAD/FAD-dependent oxidoreductase